MRSLHVSTDQPVPAISIVIPVKNEEVNLAFCLESVKDFDDVIVVDSGSTDQTCQIAAKYGRKVVNFIWNGKFPKKRNWALETVSFKHDWVLFLDADERMTPGFQQEIAAVLGTTHHNAFWLGYREWSLGKLLRHGDPMWKTALLRVGKGAYERIPEDRWSPLDMEIHEHLVVEGSVGVIGSRLEHHDKRLLDAYYARHNDYSTWEAKRYLAIGDRRQLTIRQRVKYRLLMWPFFPFMYFVFSYILKGGFLDGRVGFYYAVAKIFYFYQIQAKVTEQRIRNRRTGKI
jgi:glycosyltransferase involved in cell wall biosynthesis